MNSRLLNFPLVFVAVLTISIGSFIYNSSQSAITDAVNSLSTQETETQNSLFLMYEGKQTGSNVRALIGKLVSNANTNVDDSTKIPSVYIDQLNETSSGESEIVFKKSDEGDESEYIEELSTIRSKIDTAHEYYVEMSYQENGLIDYIHISFDPLNKIENLKYRNQKTNLFESNTFDNNTFDNNSFDNNDFDNNTDNSEETKFDTITLAEEDRVITLYRAEIDAFNNQFISYEGNQTGSNVKALMGRLIGNADTYRDEEYKIPRVYVDKVNNSTGETIEAISNGSEDIDDYISALSTIRNKVETKHEYNIKITYQERTELIDYIQISYDPENVIQEDMYR